MKSLTQKDRGPCTDPLFCHSFGGHPPHTGSTASTRRSRHNMATEVAYVCLKQNFVLRSKNNNNGYFQRLSLKTQSLCALQKHEGEWGTG